MYITADEYKLMRSNCLELLKRFFFCKKKAFNTIYTDSMLKMQTPQRSNFSKKRHTVILGAFSIVLSAIPELVR